MNYLGRGVGGFVELCFHFYCAVYETIMRQLLHRTADTFSIIVAICLKTPLKSYSFFLPKPISRRKRVV